MRLVFVGPPGSGKTAQATRFSKKYGIHRISTGSILRAIAEGRDEGRSEIRSFLESGLLVPDETIGEIVGREITSPEARRGFVLDGFPRTIPQAGALDGVLRSIDESIDLVISLRVELEELITRVSERRRCIPCGKQYFVRRHPLRKPEHCDVCGGALSRRSEDTEELMQRRLAIYREETAPILGFYASRGILREVDAMHVQDDLFRILIGVVRNRVRSP